MFSESSMNPSDPNKPHSANWDYAKILDSVLARSHHHFPDQTTKSTTEHSSCNAGNLTPLHEKHRSAHSAY